MPTSLTWSDLAFDDLSAAQCYALLRLRSEVFVIEQECLYLDIDGVDVEPGHRHLLGISPEGLAAYARVLAPEGDGPARIGRVVVHRDHRSGGTGRRLMGEALAICARHWPGRDVRIAAQAHLEGWYADLGFAAIGEVYDEDGIPHRDMVRRVA